MEKYELNGVDRVDSSSDIEQNHHFSRPDIVKKIYHFSDGYMEEKDDLENVDSEKDSQVNQVVSPAVDPSKLEWLPWTWYRTTQAGSKILQACDYVGEGLANFLGITSPKYQFEIDEYYRTKAQEEEEEVRKENEQSFGWHNSQKKNELITSENNVGTHV